MRILATKTVSLVGLVLFSSLLASPVYAGDATDEIDRLWKLGAKQHRIGQYTYSPIVTKDKAKAWGFEIQKNHKRLFLCRNDAKELGACWPVEPVAAKAVTSIPASLDRTVETIIKSEKPKLAIDYSSTGDGHPNLIVETWTGGMHCCFDYRIFSLGPKFKNFGIIHGLDSSFIFKDLDNDGACEAIGYDCNYRYWNVCFAESPSPLVILRLKDGAPRLAIALMRTTPPSPAMIQAMASDLITLTRAKPSKSRKTPPKGIFVSSKLWKEMLELIYTGNAKQAWELFDLVWPKGVQGYWSSSFIQNEKEAGMNQCLDLALGHTSNKIGRQEFLKSFKEQLSKSEYWSQLKEMNPGSL